MKRLLPIAILASAALLAALIFITRPRLDAAPLEVPPPLVRAVRVKTEPMQFVVRTQGTVKPRTESELVAQVAGEVVWVSPSLASGGFFEAGEPLVRIDPADYEADLESARASVARSESEYARAEKELKRQRRLIDQLVTSEARIDDAENAFRVAQAVVREAKARLVRAERDLARTELSAPYAGRVRSESVDVGQFVSRGNTVARLYAVDFAEVRLPLPDRELRFLDLPLSVNGRRSDAAQVAHELPEVRLRARFAGAEQNWAGQIVRTEGEIDAKTRMVHVVARVEDPYGRDAHGDSAPLAVGLFVQAEILGRTIRDAIVLPRAALREGAQGPIVLVIDAESRLRERPVEVLREQRDEVVIGDGLVAGERVCISLLRGVVDGMRVRVAEEPGSVAQVTP